MSQEAIAADIKSNNFKPIYLLHGEEAFFIDKLVDQFIASVPDINKDFDLSILYGADTKVDQVINTVKRFPMAADKHVVILREAQQMKGIPDLMAIIENPSLSTVFVCAFAGKVDMRKKWVKALKKVGTVFSSAKVNDWDMEKWIVNETQKRGFSIDQKSCNMLYEFIGNDLSRIDSELKKLALLTGEEKRITPELIERNIGISRNYNIFELQDALLKKDLLKLNTIVKYYGENAKDHPLPMITASLYSFFSKLILVHASKAFDASSAAKVLKVKPFYAGKLVAGAKKYSYGKLIGNMEVLSTYDLKAKGVDSFDESPAALMKEMFFKLTH